MNIFHLDSNPARSAQYHCDKHVVKMCTEYCQILSSVCHYFDLGTDDLYRKTHINHPCVVWARESRQNFEYLLELSIELFAEYTHRYGKVHASSRLTPIFIDLIDKIPLGKNELTNFVAVIPGQVIYGSTQTTIELYRNLYLNEKRYMTSWKNRDIPNWFI